jgi:hypothetical protein
MHTKFNKDCLDIQKLMVGGVHIQRERHTHTHTQQGDLILEFLFSQNKESKLMRKFCCLWVCRVPEPVFMKAGVYNMPPEPINHSYPSVSVSCVIKTDSAFKS